MLLRRLGVIVLLALVLITFTVGAAFAKEEDRENLPRVTGDGKVRLEIISPAHDGENAGSDITFLFKATDQNGRPLDNLNLNFTAIRDYSGQVKKEHNGPRDPVVGPLPLQATGNPGEYRVTANFWHNGHWQLRVNGSDLSKTLFYTQAIGSNPAEGTGFSWDWLIWPGMLLLAIIVVVFIGTRGDKFPVPAEEVKGFRPVADSGR
jgi:hypothetical protein